MKCWNHVLRFPLPRHFFDKYNTNVENDHWYPKDPEKRQEVTKSLKTV